MMNSAPPAPPPQSLPSHAGLAAVGGADVGGDGERGAGVDGGGAAAHEASELVGQHAQQVARGGDLDGLRPPAPPLPATPGRLHVVAVRAAVGYGRAPTSSLRITARSALIPPSPAKMETVSGSPRIGSPPTKKKGFTQNPHSFSFSFVSQNRNRFRLPGAGFSHTKKEKKRKRKTISHDDKISLDPCVKVFPLPAKKNPEASKFSLQKPRIHSFPRTMDLLPKVDPWISLGIRQLKN